MAERMNDLTGKEWLMNSFSIWRDIDKTSEERKLKHPAMFPQQLVERLISIYTKDSGEVILDPFMGSGSTIMGAYNLGRKGIGFDLSKEYCKLTNERVKKYRKELQDSGDEVERFDPELHCADSRKILKKVEAESVDLVVTSPPYWDILNMKRSADNKEIRNYSDSKKDLGNISEYDAFLTDLKEVYAEVYKALKPNKRCISVVMDIRKKDKFYPLHEDQTRIMREVGFELEEYVIWDRQKEYNNMKTLGYPWVFRFNKVHEFVCVYWKR